MKTPRQILFQRHREVGPKLDAIRDQALAELLPTTGSTTPEPRKGRWDFVAALGLAWRGLIVPSKRAWACLVVLWVILLGVNLDLRAPGPATSAVGKSSAAEMARAITQQRRVLAELFQASKLPPVESIAPGRAGKRSERTRFLNPC